MNPLGLVYISDEGNELEDRTYEHVGTRNSKNDQIQFSLKKIPVLEQRSSYSGSSVDIISVSDINELANTFDHLSHST